MSTTWFNGCRFRRLTVLDFGTLEAPAVVARTRFRAVDVVGLLDRII